MALKCACGRMYDGPSDMTQVCNGCSTPSPKHAKLFPLGGGKTVLLCEDCCARLGNESIQDIIANPNSTAPLSPGQTTIEVEPDEPEPHH